MSIKWGVHVRLHGAMWDCTNLLFQVIEMEQVSPIRTHNWYGNELKRGMFMHSLTDFTEGRFDILTVCPCQLTVVKESIECEDNFKSVIENPTQYFLRLISWFCQIHQIIYGKDNVSAYYPNLSDNAFDNFGQHAAYVIFYTNKTPQNVTGAQIWIYEVVIKSYFPLNHF